MQHVPIPTTHLFAALDNALVELLRGLNEEEWQRQTISPKWKVKDVAAHLLDGMLRKLSLARDKHFAEAPKSGSAEDVAAFVNRLNAEGVRVYRRLSPQVLCDLLDIAAAQSRGFHESLDPMAAAIFPVSWAGESESANWFDIAREYTERWHHQQQIRLAVGKPGMMEREYYFPVLDTFMRSLPHVYSDVAATERSTLKVTVTGEAGGEWFLQKEAAGWMLLPAYEGSFVAEVGIPQAIAWRVFTKGVAREEAEGQMSFRGDERLAKRILSAVAIVA